MAGMLGRQVMHHCIDAGVGYHIQVFVVQHFLQECGIGISTVAGQNFVANLFLLRGECHVIFYFSEFKNCKLLYNSCGR